MKRADVVTPLQPQQARLADAAVPGTRVLLDHALGSGKTLSALAVADRLAQPYASVVPASLRRNLKGEEERHLKNPQPHETFSYNQLAQGAQPQEPTLIFDEAHRLRNPESKQTQAAIAAAQRAKNLILLSGSPIVNSPTDLAPLMTMLTGDEWSPERFNKTFLRTHPVSPGFFNRLRGVKPGLVTEPQHLDQLREVLKNHFDQYAPSQPAVERSDEDVHVRMTPDQLNLYQGFWGKLPAALRWKISGQFPLSAQESAKLNAFLTGPREVSLSTLPFRADQNAYKAFQESPKLEAAFSRLRETLKDPKAKAVAYSNFIDAGLVPYEAALKHEHLPAALYSSRIPAAQRAELVKNFNSGKLRALLLGPSGGEGISLKGTRLLQLLDPHWNEARSNQAAGRAIRFDSHADLPIDDRNVKVQRFYADPPEKRTWGQWLWGLPKPPAVGADEYLRRRAAEKEKLNQSFLHALEGMRLEKGGAALPTPTAALSELRRRVAA